jgi:hypothetical protein
VRRRIGGFGPVFFQASAREACFRASLSLPGLVMSLSTLDDACWLALLALLELPLRHNASGDCPIWGGDKIVPSGPRKVPYGHLPPTRVSRAPGSASSTDSRTAVLQRHSGGREDDLVS